jgi:hypothetical protein
MDLEGRHCRMNAKIRKARTASDRFVFSGCRGDHIHMNAKVGLGVLMTGLCVTNLEGRHHHEKRRAC